MKRPVILGALGALTVALVPALATAAVNPVAPAPGERVTTAKPTFVWTVLEHETAQLLSISTSPKVKGNGTFASPVLAGRLAEADTSYRPTRPLAAGTYWWSVETFAQNPFRALWSAPMPFTVAGKARVKRPSLRMFKTIDTAIITVTWNGNIKPATVITTVRKGKRKLWSKKTREPGARIDRENRVFVRWKNTKVAEDARVTLQVRVRGAGQMFTKTVTVRAP